jgi:Glycosyl transferase family 2
MGASEPNGQPWLTIALPVYNVAAYLPACLESIFAQIDHGVEVLAVEDCSTDITPDVLRAQQQRWPSLRVVQHERNLGLSGARNTGLANAQGTYIWFLDADDLMLPGAIAQLRQTIDQWQPDLVMCDFSVLREQMKLKHRLRGELHRSTFSGPGRTLMEDPMQVIAGAMRAGQLHTWSKIARRNLWGDDLRFPLGKAFEDLYTTPTLLGRARRAVHVPVPWVAYRQREGSILNTASHAKVLDQCLALRHWPTVGSDRSSTMSARAQFEQGAQKARILTGAWKTLWRLRTNPEALSLLKIELENYMAPMNKTLALSLIFQLISKGRIARALRLCYWISIGLRRCDALDLRK